MDRPMIDIASELLALSELLETSQKKDPKRAYEHLELFRQLAGVVKASLNENTAASTAAAFTPPLLSSSPTKNAPVVGPPPKVFQKPALAAAAAMNTQTLSQPRASNRHSSPAAFYDALRARAASRLSSSRILRPKPGT